MLLCGEPPFNGNSGKEVLDAVQRGEFKVESSIWSHIADDAKDLLHGMMCPIEERLSAEEAYHHPYFDKL